MEFKPQEHVIVMERKSKNKETNQWVTTQTEYLPVSWRIFWFRIDNPKGKIDSHALTLDLERGAAIFETYVEREDGGSARMHGSETAGDWKDYIEKAQTKSLGRALAAVGYGSQFTDDEFTEGERIVDSPVDRGQAQAAEKPKAAPGTEHLVNGNGSPAFPANKDTVAITRGDLFARGEERGMWTRMAPSAFYAMASAITGRSQSKQDWTMTADEMAEMARQIEVERAAKGNEQPAA